MNNIEKSKQALAAWRHTKPRKNKRSWWQKFFRRKPKPRHLWWLKAVGYNLFSITDSRILDDDGYEVEYSLWSPERLNLDMSQVEKLALWDRKYDRERNCHVTKF